MPLTVVVSPNTGSFATMAIAGVSWYLPPNGMSTVAAPMVESKRSESPLFDATFRSLTTERMRASRVSPAKSGW